MSTTVVRPARVRADDIFFPSMAILVLGIVFTGFARSYFLAGMFHAKLPNLLVHLHGAVFVSWILLLVAQAWLVAAHAVKWHMRLGFLSLVLIPSMVILGILTLFDFMHRVQPREGPEAILVGDLEMLTIFVALTSWGLLARRDPVSHKRLMLLGTLAIMGPAISRWNLSIPAIIALIFVLPLLVLAYDLWSLKRVHRTTLVATASTAVWVFTLLPFSNLPFWHRCVEWLRQR